MDTSSDAKAFQSEISGHSTEEGSRASLMGSKASTNLAITTGNPVKEDSGQQLKETLDKEHATEDKTSASGDGNTTTNHTLQPPEEDVPVSIGPENRIFNTKLDEQLAKDQTVLESGKTVSPEDATAAMKDGPTAAKTDTIGEPAPAPAPASAGASTIRRWEAMSVDMAKARTRLKITDEHGRRIDNIEDRLRVSEEQRVKLEKQLAEVSESFNAMRHRHDVLSRNRAQERSRYEERMEDRDKEEDRLRRRVKLLEDQLFEARKKASQSLTKPAQSDFIKLQWNFDQVVLRESKLIAELVSERDKSKRLEKQLSDQVPWEYEEELDRLSPEQVKLIRIKLQKTRADLQASQKNYLQARSEINRLNLSRFPTAIQFLEHYSKLLDPHSKLYQTMVVIANYRDGTGKEPTAEQRAEFRLFRDYLEERADILRQAVGLNDPRPILQKFDDRWADEAISNDWGAMITLRLSATRAATALRFAPSIEEKLEALEEMNASNKISRHRLGEDHDSGIAETVNDLHDEMEKLKRPRAKA